MAIRTIVLQSVLGMEIIYSFVIILSSLLIYYGTKELYELTNHKGIKYFRLAFLFFALTYLLRFVVQLFFLVFHFPRNFQTELGLISIVTLILFMYASTAAILYLGASIHWKWFGKKKYRSVLLHSIALLVSIIGIGTQNAIFLLFAQGVVIIALAVITYKRENHLKKNAQKLYLLYGAIALFWVLNVLDLILPNFFQLTKLLIYLVSIALFQTLFYRVLKAGK